VFCEAAVSGESVLAYQEASRVFLPLSVFSVPLCAPWSAFFVSIKENLAHPACGYFSDVSEISWDVDLTPTNGPIPAWFAFEFLDVPDHERSFSYSRSFAVQISCQKFA
jgi:hypothetical protein